MLNISQIRKKVIPILKRYGVKHSGIFGSFSRGEANSESDIDILVEIDRDISLLDFIGLKVEIEETLGRKIDLVEYDAIKPSIKQRILEEQIPIL